LWELKFISVHGVMTKAVVIQSVGDVLTRWSGLELTILLSYSSLRNTKQF